ncbi:jg23937 [Pararge aegeria aegeria]|uniref:Jg23937 protein n=1 Tax=Pararge aegeria aegeria TaxID=348720 RepID=A0A8S4RN50_9NEOP|nr:jg23937 [Pararge aegeria aegeria]
MHLPKLRLDEMLTPKSSIWSPIGTDTPRKVGAKVKGLFFGENKHACVLAALNLTKLASPQSDIYFRVKLIRSTKDSLCSRISLALSLGLDKYLSVTVLSSAYLKRLGFKRSLMYRRKRVAERKDP